MDGAVQCLDVLRGGFRPSHRYNAPLQAAWSGMMFSKAAELLAHATGGSGGANSGWTIAEQAQLANMLHR